MNEDMTRLMQEQELAEHWAEQIDTKDLLQYFIEGQMEYLSDLTEEELLAYRIEEGLVEEDAKDE